MPLQQSTPYVEPILIYDAPIDEKTKKIREMFKVDEKTGYPEHYNWRPMARLGSKYKPADPYRKFDPYEPSTEVATKTALVSLAGICCFSVHWFYAFVERRPWWSRFYIFAGSFAASSAFALWMHERALIRQGIKNGIVVDYAEKHPERFGEIHRPKMREVLFKYIPIR